MDNKHQKVWNCLIIDDEPLAVELLKSYLKNIDVLNLKGECHNAFDALNFLRSNSLDLIFLDIQMPQLTGLEFLRSLNKPPMVIITTAYREYAVEGFDLDVIDYLVKPISLERFLRSFNKVLARHNSNEEISEKLPDANNPYVFYKVEKEMVKVYLNQILWIESIKDYMKIVMEGNKIIITYQKISYAEEKLPTNLFLRVHRSYIIAKTKISGYSVGKIKINEHYIPVGRSYQQKVHKELNHSIT